MAKKIMLTQAKDNLKLIYHEVFGEKTDHPLIIRFFAFIVDYMIFLGSGMVVYYGLEGINKQSAANQLIVDIILWTTYFTFGNSKIFQGQTIGKKLLRIRVVDSEGNYLGLGKSLIRSIPIVLLMNSYPIMYYIITEQKTLYTFGLCTLTTILFGSIYFPLLKINRQALHDLLVHSQVIPKARTIRIEKKMNWKLILGFTFIITAYVSFMAVRN